MTIQPRIILALVGALFATVLATQAPASGQGTPTCNGLEATIIGTEGRDNLRGTTGDDVIVGLGGRDRIVGLGGNDTICGGTGRDLIRGNNGRDTILGEGGRDRIFGGGGADIIRGMGGNDRISGGNGRDHIHGGIGDDHADGGFADDTCVDTIYVRHCEELVGLVSVAAGYDGKPGWTALVGTVSLRIAMSDDGRYAVFTGHPDDDRRRIDVVLRDMIENTFTVVGQSRTRKNPFLAGIDISGDGSTIAFSTNADGVIEGDDTDGYRLYLVDREDGTIERMPIPDNFDLNGVYRPTLSFDGSVVAYELASTLVGVRREDAISIVRHTRGGPLQIVNEGANGNLFEARGAILSGDGSTVAFNSESHGLPGETNGTYADPIIWADGSHSIAYPELIHRRTTTGAYGLNQDGSTLVGTLGRSTEYYDNRIVFYDTTDGSTTTVRADSFCTDCKFNHAAYEGSWVAANLLKNPTDDGEPQVSKGIALFTQDGRREVVLPEERSWIAGISSDGAVLAILPFTADPYLLLFRDPSS